MNDGIIVVRCKNCGNVVQTFYRGGITKGYLKCYYCGKRINKWKKNRLLGE